MPVYLETQKNLTAQVQQQQVQQQETQQQETHLQDQVLVCILCNSVTSVSKTDHICSVRNNSDISVRRNNTI